MATATVEDYLKRIYLLEQELDGVVPMGVLAAALGVVPGTATVMVQKLAKSGHVDYAPYAGVRLTENGARIALDVLRKHRLIESLLVDVLGLDWSEVHEEAERLEHAVSDKLLEAIDRHLGYPQFDPHGDPIPSASGAVTEHASIPLADCGVGHTGTVARVASQEETFLRYAAEHGLRPDARINVTARDDESVTVQSSTGETAVIPMQAARDVLVRS